MLINYYGRNKGKHPAPLQLYLIVNLILWHFTLWHFISTQLEIKWTIYACYEVGHLFSLEMALNFHVFCNRLLRVKNMKHFVSNLLIWCQKWDVPFIVAPQLDSYILTAACPVGGAAVCKVVHNNTHSRAGGLRQWWWRHWGWHQFTNLFYILPVWILQSVHKIVFLCLLVLIRAWVLNFAESFILLCLSWFHVIRRGYQAVFES